MDFYGLMKMSDFWVLLFCCLFCLMGSFTACGNVVLIGNNVTLSFDDIEANFGEFTFDFSLLFSWGCGPTVFLGVCV